MKNLQETYLLAVDVGNSRIKFGLFERCRRGGLNAPRGGGGLLVCLHAAAAVLDGELPWERVLGWLDKASRAEGIVAGTNPRGVERVLAEWPQELGPLPRLLEDATVLPITVRVDEPRRVGIDRVLNAVAANVLRPAGHGAIVIDTGTATTVDCVSAEGAFEGGAILPGFELSARSLHQYTARLPLVATEELASEAHVPLGRNTRAALRSGLYWGQLGAVRELVTRLSEGAPRPPLLLLTGGGGELLAAELREARWEPHLGLQGMALVAAAEWACRAAPEAAS